MPTTNQIELVSQAVEYVTFGTQISDGLAWLPISDSDVEVTAQYKLGLVPKQGNAIENALYRTDVSTLTDRSVNAEHY